MQRKQKPWDWRGKDESPVHDDFAIEPDEAIDSAGVEADVEEAGDWAPLFERHVRWGRVVFVEEEEAREELENGASDHSRRRRVIDVSQEPKSDAPDASSFDSVSVKLVGSVLGGLTLVGITEKELSHRYPVIAANSGMFSVGFGLLLVGVWYSLNRRKKR